MNAATGGNFSKEENNLPCCKESWTDVSETVALIVFICNIITPGFGLFIASILDQKGCNWTAFLTSWLMAITSAVFGLGWIWSILHGFRLYEGSKGKQ